jgi:hypothetical protein
LLSICVNLTLGFIRALWPKPRLRTGLYQEDPRDKHLHESSAIGITAVVQASSAQHPAMVKVVLSSFGACSAADACAARAANALFSTARQMDSADRGAADEPPNANRSRHLALRWN